MGTTDSNRGSIEKYRWSKIKKRPGNECSSTWKVVMLMHTPRIMRDVGVLIIAE